MYVHLAIYLALKTNFTKIKTLRNDNTLLGLKDCDFGF